MVLKIVFTLFLFLLACRPFLSSMASPREDIAFSCIFVIVSLLLLRKNTLLLLKRPSSFFAALFLLAVLISLSFSQDLEKSLSEFYKYATYFLAFFAVSSFDAQERKCLLKILILSCALVSFYALHWLIGGLFSTLDYLHNCGITEGFAVEYLSRGRAFVPFPTPSALAGYLILLAPLSATLILETGKNTLKNSVSLLAVALTYIALLATQSIGAFLSLTLSVVIFLYARKKRPPKRIILLILCGLILSGLILFFLRNNSLYIFNTPIFSLSNRLSYWREAINVISQHPLAGVGLGNYPFFKSISPHNSYLQIWAEMGILGLISFAGLSFKTLTTHEGTQNNALWIGSLAFLIHNLADFTFFQPQISLLWWVVAALLTSTKNKAEL
ncbi:MAG: O-antigen ligase family protein [Candidatus Omnitrophota bacterium]